MIYYKVINRKLGVILFLNKMFVLYFTLVNSYDIKQFIFMLTMHQFIINKDNTTLVHRLICLYIFIMLFLYVKGVLIIVNLQIVNNETLKINKTIYMLSIL